MEVDGEENGKQSAGGFHGRNIGESRHDRRAANLWANLWVEQKQKSLAVLRSELSGRVTGVTGREFRDIYPSNSAEMLVTRSGLFIRV
jgi:hypothetical protein